MLILKIKKRYFLKKKKVKEIKNELGDYGSFINNKDTLEMLEAEDYDFILVNGEPYIIMINGKPYPTLKAALNMELDSKVVVVDMGAVRFVQALLMQMNQSWKMTLSSLWKRPIISL